MLRSRSCSFPYFKVQIYCSIIPQFLLFPVLEVSHLPGYGWFGKHVGIGMDIFIDLPGLNIYGEMWFWWSGRMIYRLAFQATIPCCIESIPGSMYFPESTGITALATLWNVSDLGLHNSAAKQREIVAIRQDTVKCFSYPFTYLCRHIQWVEYSTIKSSIFLQTEYRYRRIYIFPHILISLDKLLSSFCSTNFLIENFIYLF